MDSSSHSVEYVDPEKAATYMKENVEPILSALIAELTLKQPPNTLEFIREFAQQKLDERVETHENSNEEKQSRPVCCFSGFEAELKVRTVDGEISYYTEDAYTALRRKNKLRGSISVPIGEEFPASSEHDKHPSEIDWTPLSDDAPSVKELDERPVTPPKRGFTMTLPGKNYHEEGSIVGSSSGTNNDGPQRYVSFEPKALGTVSETKCAGEEKLDTLEEKREAMLKAVERRENSNPVPLGSDHLLSQEKRAELEERRKRDDMIGTIMAYYNSMGGSAPFGLPAASMDVLERHYRKCKKEMNRQALDKSQVASSEEKSQQIAAKILQSGKSTGTSGPRVFKFEPRAFGTTEPHEQGSGEKCAKLELDPAERRRLVAQAASKRFGTDPDTTTSAVTA